MRRKLENLIISLQKEVEALEKFKQDAENSKDWKTAEIAEDDIKRAKSLIKTQQKKLDEKLKQGDF